MKTENKNLWALVAEQREWKEKNIIFYKNQSVPFQLNQF